MCIRDRYLADDIIGAQSMLELVEDKNEQYHYLSYQIYLKLDDLNNANKSLQAAVKQNPDKYSVEGIQLGELINDLKNVSKTLSSGFVLEAIEETEALSQEKCVLNGNKKTAKLSPAPLLIEVRVKQ